MPSLMLNETGRKPRTMAKQLAIDFTRSEQLALLRDCRLGDPRKRNDRKPLAKLLLRSLDDRIGRNKRWAITVEELGEESEMSRSAVYKWLGWLSAAELIGFDELPDGRREFWICWSNVWAMTPAGRAAEREARDAVSPPRGPRVHIVDHESTMWNGSPQCGMVVHNVDCSYKEERPLSAQLAPSSPPPPREELVTMVRTAGVNLAEETIATATANGLSSDQIAAVVAHYQAFPGRWNPGILYERLTRPGVQNDPPDHGWYGDSEAWLAAQRHQAAIAQQEASRQALAAENAQQAESRRELTELNALVGELLDSMPLDELRALVPDDHPRANQLRQAIRFRTIDLMRIEFLRLIVTATGGWDGSAERCLLDDAGTSTTLVPAPGGA